MKTPEAITIDFETFPIQQRPEYPPRPVGVAVKLPGQKGQYFTPDAAQSAIEGAWQSGLPILCHNSKFDLAVAYERLGMPKLPWQRVHDTMFLAYLYDPHAPQLGLKPLAESLLQWSPDERNELDDWIWAHREALEQQYGAIYGSVTKKKLGKWIFAAPVELVSRYAIGDVERTAALFEHLWPVIQNEGMGAAYDRERQLLPILMENEERGIRVDLPGLERDIPVYSAALTQVEDSLRGVLNASGLNFDADKDVANVLLERGIVPAENWSRTKATKNHPNGQLSVSKETLLPSLFTGPNGAEIASALGYRNRLKTCLTMFMEPWHGQASKRGGYMSTEWNQVRNPTGGTRTGRPSTSNPNLLNISKDFEGRTDEYVHPTFLSLPPLPLVRKYVLPDEGEVFLHRDFDGQELRIFAHGEQGALWQAYQDNPELDPHGWVGATLKELLGYEMERTKIKVLNFQALYGGGVPAAQKKLNCSYAEAKQYKSFHDRALPGRKQLTEGILRVIRSGQPIRTWGGRLYRAEKPKLIDGDWRTQEYKLINYWVQGSAADLTKQAIIDWHAVPWRTSRFLVTVYDEINISCAPEHAAVEMKTLKEVMEAPRLSVPMRSSGKQGPSWGELVKCQ